MEQVIVTAMKSKIDDKTDSRGNSTRGLAAMLDYAIVEGAELRLPLFVCLLRLARLALKEEMEEGLASKH
jgi:hypothetical protein